MHDAHRTCSLGTLSDNLDDQVPQGNEGETARSLRRLVAATDLDAAVPDLAVTGISADSRKLSKGEIFVAVRGASMDGHEHLEEAVARGAAALVVERPVLGAAVPVIEVPDSRVALAELAAAWYGRPADELSLVGISGTLGKTSVLTMLERILLLASKPIGSIGSLGVRRMGETLSETGYTAPDPLRLHESLARLRDDGCELVAMEVTSHALAQQRVHGLPFDLAIFTNLVPLEHVDYHGSFADYVAAKSRFFDHIGSDAPVIYNADDRAVETLIRERDLRGVGVGCGGEAPVVRIGAVRTAANGTRFALEIGTGLPTYASRTLPPTSVPLSLRLLGRSNVTNAALAATGALFLGVAAETVGTALAGFPPPRRRMELHQMGGLQILDDTVGHPESISSVFSVVEALDPPGLHIAYAIRGSRGPEINVQTAEALATWIQRGPAATLVVTRSAEAVDERNTVSEEEHEAFTDTLRSAGIPFEEETRLDRAVRKVLEAAAPGDLVLLLGAQGMDDGATVARDWFTPGPSLAPS